jgi:hypothetical protein
MIRSVLLPAGHATFGGQLRLSFGIPSSGETLLAYQPQGALWLAGQKIMWLQEFYWVPQLPTLVMSHRTKGYLYSGVTKLVSSHEIIDACVAEVTKQQPSTPHRNLRVQNS